MTRFQSKIENACHLLIILGALGLAIVVAFVGYPHTITMREVFERLS